ncbi:MAG: GNAT family N-acetyltransferase, partial [Roseobacter sp.]
MIRPAEIGDAPAIANLWNWMIRETLATFTTELKSVAAIEGMLKQRPDGFFIAEEAGDLSGFVTFGPFRAGPGYAKTCEHSVVVPPGGQNRGIGSDLMRRAMHAAERAGCHVMVGAISGANPKAVRFHEKLGFREVGLMPEVGRKAGQWL